MVHNKKGISHNLANQKQGTMHKHRSITCWGKQVDIHAPWGGVVPNLASEAHKQAMEGVVQDALQQAGLRPQQLDAVAVTIGPGLSLCLKVRLPLALTRFCTIQGSISRKTSSGSSPQAQASASA